MTSMVPIAIEFEIEDNRNVRINEKDAEEHEESNYLKKKMNYVKR